jgi:ubiquinol-cytochrome c reductase cytochrome b subunit
MPFVILGLTIVHIVFLHEHMSNNPLGVSFAVDGIYFFPYYIVKDLLGIIIFLMFFSWFLFFMPNVLGHPDNYIEANPLVTPAHIVPEWYFLPFYAILRAIPDKLSGVIALLCAILTLLVLPYISWAQYRSISFKPMMVPFFWFFVFNCFLLGWIGSKPVEFPFVGLGQLGTFLYFFMLLFVFPFISYFELALVVWFDTWLFFVLFFKLPTKASGDVLMPMLYWPIKRQNRVKKYKVFDFHKIF